MNTPIPPLIGLTGHRRSDASVAALYLCRQHGFTEYAVDTPLRAIARASDPIIGPKAERLDILVERHGWSWLESSEQFGPEVERLLSGLGEGLRTVIGPHALLGGLNQAIDNRVQGLVVTHVRHDAEAAVIRAHGGRMVEISAPGYEWNKISSHLIDHQFRNRGSLNDLYGSIDNVLQRKPSP